MITDVILLQENNENIRDILDKIELMAQYAGMGRREASAMCLVAEEMILATQNIIDSYATNVWMEITDKKFDIHLALEAAVITDEREKLLKLSKSGKNSKQKGFFGFLSAKINDFFLASSDVNLDQAFTGSAFMHNLPMYDYGFTYRDYQRDFEANKQKKAEEEDELVGVEKSIIDAMVDDITVGISTGKIELVASKNLKKE